MKKLHRIFITGAMVAGSLAMTAPFAMANTVITMTTVNSHSAPGAVANDVGVPSTSSLQQTSVTLLIPSLDSKLVPMPTLSFTFTPTDSSVTPITVTGTYIAGSTDEYNVPVPNFGQSETVNISTAYTNNGVNYTATAGPLVDTLPEAPLAAALPLGMLGVWYIMRKRRLATQ